MRERAIFLLKQQMLNGQGVSPIISSSTSISTTSSTSSSSTSVATTIGLSAQKKLLLEIFDKQLVVAQKNLVEQELDNYLTPTSMVTNEEADDILSYWKEHQHVKP